MEYGTVKKYESARGFGFIESDDDEELFLKMTNNKLLMKMKQMYRLTMYMTI